MSGPRSRRRAIVATIASLTVASAAVAFDPSDGRVIVQIELAVVGTIAVLVAAGALRRAAPLAGPSPLDRVPSAPRSSASALPRDLTRVARRIAASEASAADARRHLSSTVALVAADRIRRGAHIAIEPVSVYASLPRPVPQALALVLDPALAGRDTRAMPGLDAAGADALVRALEQL